MLNTLTTSVLASLLVLLSALVAQSGPVILKGGGGGGGGGSFTFVASASGSSDGTTTTVATTGDPLNVATGDLLIALVTWEDGGATISSITDGGSNTFTMDGEGFNDASTFINGEPGYRLAGVANASAEFTATLSASRGFKKLIVMQYRPASGETVTKDISGTREADGNGSSVTTGSFSTTGTDGVVCGLVGIYASGTHSSSTVGGVSASQTKQEGGGYVWCRITTAGLTTQTAATTYSASNFWAASVIAFKAE